MLPANQFNPRLYLTIILLVLIIEARLFVAAEEFNNWHGFWLSSLHVGLIAAAALLVLRRKPD